MCFLFVHGKITNLDIMYLRLSPTKINLNRNVSRTYTLLYCLSDLPAIIRFFWRHDNVEKNETLFDTVSYVSGVKCEGVSIIQRSLSDGHVYVFVLKVRVEITNAHVSVTINMGTLQRSLDSISNKKNQRTLYLFDVEIVFRLISRSCFIVNSSA
jgi:hypothetical protein